MTARRLQIAHSGIGCAHLPDPLTASGAADARPSCLPFPAKQRTETEPSASIRPFLPASRGLRARLSLERFGEFIPSYSAFSPPHDCADRGLSPHECDSQHSNLSPAHKLLRPERTGRTTTTCDHPELIGRKGEYLPFFLCRQHSSESLAHRPSHQQRRPMRQTDRSCHSPSIRISLPSASSRSSAYQEETVVSRGAFNPSPASGLASREDLFGNFPRSNVMRESDFPGGNHIALFCCAKNLRTPRVRHAPKSIRFRPNSKNI